MTLCYGALLVWLMTICAYQEFVQHPVLSVSCCVQRSGGKEREDGAGGLPAEASGTANASMISQRTLSTYMV